MDEELARHYNISPQTRPAKRPFDRWQDDNRCGFLSGVLLHGLPEHAAEIRQVVRSELDPDAKRDSLNDLIGKLKVYYIDPFLRTDSGDQS